MYEDGDHCPCDDCDFECDGWDARYCCILCEWQYGKGNTPCEDCDPMDI